MNENNYKEAFAQVKNAASNMAIEEMYFSKEFLNKMLLVANGEIPSEQVRQEVIRKYARQ